MNSAITKGIAILLLIVAARDVEGTKELVGTAKVYDSIIAGKIGDINIWQPDTSQMQIDMQVDIPQIPEGNYVAVAYWIPCYRGKCKNGLAPSYPPVYGKPRVLFRASSTAENTGIRATVAVDDALQSYLQNGIGFYVAIYKDKPSTRIDGTPPARRVAYSYVPSELIAPERITVLTTSEE